MILILCKSYKNACKAFRLFIEFLEDNEPWSIRKLFLHENCVETDDDLRYMFIDYRFENILDKIKPDIIDVQDFFEEINELYYQEEVIDYYGL